MIISELFESPGQCPECGGISFSDLILAEKKDACYYKVKASAKVWPSAYASGRLVQCRKKGASNYGNKSEGVAEGSEDDIEDTRQFRNAIALAKSQKAIRQAKDGKNAKYYADGTKVTPDETARRAAERRAKKQGVAEGKADYNFDIEDLKRLERIRDLATLKAQALALISKPSAKPMKPEKVEWFKNALERMNSPMKVIKLMYDLLLSGEGNAVVGTRSSMNPNSYRQRFGEQGMAEGDLNELSTKKLAQYKTAAGADAKKADASGNYARGDKRFKGINRATNKQFDNDLKKHGQQSVAEDADCHDMVSRVKKLAGLGPMKTVYDPAKRQYRNMPTAQQPKK